MLSASPASSSSSATASYSSSPTAVVFTRMRHGTSSLLYASPKITTRLKRFSAFSERPLGTIRTSLLLWATSSSLASLPLLRPSPNLGEWGQRAKNYIRPLHHSVPSHVHPGPSTGFLDGRLQDPKRGLLR